MQHRRHTLDVGGSWWQRLLRKLSEMIEAGVVKVSLLGDPAIYDTAWFPWTQSLCCQWRQIRSELDLLLEQRDRLPNFQDIVIEASAITQDAGWKTFWLAGVGMDCGANRRQCPQTAQLLNRIPGLRTAFFSILAPGKHIPNHRGAYNGLLRLHLALKVPSPLERCRIRIGDQVVNWREGEVLIFDDSFQHEVWNDTLGERVVLFVDFARPLSTPWHWLNQRFLDLGYLAPFLRRAHRRQRQWMDTFYQQ